MATNEEIVAAAQQLYVSYYGRPADPAGLAFWIDKFTESDNIDQVLTDFGTSEEYLSWIDDNDLDTSEDLVNALFNQMFNRDGDEEGVAFYVDLLESGASSLSAIALDIANGAEEGSTDRMALDNKVSVANTYTAEVESSGSLYTADNIDEAAAILAGVDDSEDSVTAGNEAATEAVDSLPKTVPGGEYTLDEDDGVADFSAATAAVTVTLDGRDDEANFDVKGSAFDDTFVVEEFRSATLDGNDGTDTLDFSELSGSGTTTNVVATLLGGTFSYNTSSAQFLGTMSEFENVIGTDGDDIISGDDGDNVISGGEGNDVLKGGLGDDSFVFENEDDLANSVITGGVGTDELVLTAATIDLTNVNNAANNIDVEGLRLTNLDEEDAVVVTANNTFLGNLSSITGSDAVDTVIDNNGAVDLSGATISDVEVLDISAGAGDLTISGSTFTGAIQILGDTVGGTDDIVTSGTAGDTIDVSDLVLNHIDQIVMAGGAETLIISQAQIDALVDTNNAAIFSGATSSDSIEFSSSVDLGDVPGAQLGFGVIDFGEAVSVTMADVDASGNISSILGTSSTSNILALEDVGGDGEDLTGIVLDGIERLVIDPDAGGTTVIVDERSLGGVTTLQGDFTLSANTNDITGQELISLLGMTFDGDVTLAGDTTNLMLINQDVIDSIAGTTAFGGAALVSLGDLDVSSSDLSLGIGTTVIAAGSGATITGNSASLTQVYVFAGDGGTFVPDSTLTAGGTSSQIIVGSAGDDTITVQQVAGGGSNTSVTGGAGNDTFNLTMKSLGATLGDFNTGTARDTLNLSVGVGTATVSGTRTMLTGHASIRGGSDGSDTVTADPFTASGGLRYLNGNSSIVTVAPGSALGNTVALPLISSAAASLTAGASLVISAVTAITANSLVNTTFVRFYIVTSVTVGTQTGLNVLYMAHVGAGSIAAATATSVVTLSSGTNTNAILGSEVLVSTVAVLGSDSLIAGSDLILV